MHTDKHAYWSILIDLQKAFNTLDHKVLLKKMTYQQVLLKKITYLAFKTSSIKWFESYLSSKIFFISVDDIFVGGWNFTLWWSLEAYSRVTRVFDRYQRSSPIIIKKWLLPSCWWSEYFLSRRRHSQNWRCFNQKVLNTLWMVYW